MPAKISIYVMTEYDLLSTSKSSGNYYVCTDSRKMYKDTSNTTRVALNVTMINTEVDRVYNVRPNNGTLYYVWETNVLWLYNAGWIIQAGNQDFSNGYYYNSSGNIASTDDINTVLDNNGLLRDGSVVVRDINRIIKGKLFIDGQNNNLVISSFLGGGIQVLPNGDIESKGSLLINPRTILKVVYVNSITGEIMDNDKYLIAEQFYGDESAPERTLYDIFEALTEMGVCPPDITEDNYSEYEQVLRKLCDTYLNADNYEGMKSVLSVDDGYAIYDGELNTTDEIYVNIRYPLTTYQLELLDCDENTDISVLFELLKKCKLVNEEDEITDYTNEEIIQIMNIFKSDAYSADPPKYKVWHEGNLIPEDIILNPEGILQSLHQLPTPIDLDVDLLDGHHATDFASVSHTHSTDDVVGLLDVINGRFAKLLPQPYGTNGILVQYDSKADKYNFTARNFRITLFGDITGSIDIVGLNDVSSNITVIPDNHIHDIVHKDSETEDFLFNEDYKGLQDYILYGLSFKLDSSETTHIPMANKILYLDANGDLPANITGNAASSDTADKLDKEVIISLSGGATGSTTFDGSKNVDIEVTVDPSKHNHDDRYILLTSLGVTVAPLDEDTGVVPLSFLPEEVKNAVKYQGEYNPGSIVIVDIGNYAVYSKYYTDRGMEVPSVPSGITKDDFNLPLNPGEYTIEDEEHYCVWMKDVYLELLDITDEAYLLPQNPTQGSYWVITGDGEFNGVHVSTDDWVVYNGNSWDIIDNRRYITSVNGYSDSDIFLNYKDVKAISSEYIDYYKSIVSGTGYEVYEEFYISTGGQVPPKPVGDIDYPITLDNYKIEANSAGQQLYCVWLDGVYVYITDPVINNDIPAGKIVITDSDNYTSIRSAESSKLSNKFRVLSTIDSDVSISDNGLNTTDGSQNVALTMKISDSFKPSVSLLTTSSTSIDLAVNGI